MGGSTRSDALSAVEWGTATAVSVGAEPPAAAGCPPAAGWPTAVHADRWAAGVRQVTGCAPRTARAVLGWPHFQPDGPGRWDSSAIGRCDRALDDALSRGLRPAVTLLHLDLPPWVAAAGGWMSRDTATRFAEHAVAVGERFGDRVVRWITSSDLAAPSLADHVAGMFPPGRGRGLAGLASVHHVLLGHGLALQGLRSAGVAGEIGTTTVLHGGYPATPDPWDRVAVEEYETWGNGLFLDPLLLGRHLSRDGGPSLVERTGCVRDGDLEIISSPLDVLALSWHEPVRVTVPENLPLLLPADGSFQALNDVNRLLARLGFVLAPFDEVESNSFGWPIIPEGLLDALDAVGARYAGALPALHVVDNGMGDLHLADDADDADGARSCTLQERRMSWLALAVADGLDVRGYEYWSVLDNLDWKAGYACRYQRCVGRPATPAPPMPREWTESAARALLPDEAVRATAEAASLGTPDVRLRLA